MASKIAGCGETVAMETKHRNVVVSAFLSCTECPPLWVRFLRTLSLSTTRCLAKLREEKKNKIENIWWNGMTF